VRPGPDYSRQTCNRRPWPTFPETVNPCVTSTPWPHVCQMTGKMMYGRKSDADFETGCRLPVAPPQDLENEPSRKRSLSGPVRAAKQNSPSHGFRFQRDDCGSVSHNAGWVSPIAGLAPPIISPNVDRFRPMIAGRATDDCRSLQLTIGSAIS